MEDTLLDIKGLCALLKVTPKRVHFMTRDGLPFLQLGQGVRNRRWLPSAVQEYLKTHQQTLGDRVKPRDARAYRRAEFGRFSPTQQAQSEPKTAAG